MIGKNYSPSPLIRLWIVTLSFYSLNAQNTGVPEFKRPSPEKSSVTDSTPAASPATSAATPASSEEKTLPLINSAANDYILNASDTLEMSIFHEPDLSTRSHIGSDGTVQLPLLGDVKVAGMTVRDARELIRKRYDEKYLVSPQVYLNVVDYAQRKFTILGQVLKPGTYEIPGGSTLTLLEAIGLAGGFTRSADRGKIIVQRSNKESIKVNVKKSGSAEKEGLNVKPGDIITISESWF